MMANTNLNSKTNNDALRNTICIDKGASLVFGKKLRVEKDYSWRAVARDVSAEYPELGVDGDIEYNRGNQIDGMALCDAAMKLLGETVEDGWN